VPGFYERFSRMETTLNMARGLVRRRYVASTGTAEVWSTEAWGTRASSKAETEEAADAE
jgi:hypothetical protein